MSGTQNVSRRELLKTCGLGATSLALSEIESAWAADTPPKQMKFGMCDWSMGRMDPSAFELAKEIGLDGVQVSIGSQENNLWLRQKKMQEQYLEASRKTGVAIASMAMGVLNNVPLMSEPVAALWTADTIEVSKALKAPIILLAFFSTGELREQDETNMKRVVAVLKELAPRAEKAGAILGLETYLSAETHLKIIEQVGSPAVQVYYDVYNADHAGHDYLKEIELLGKHIREVHFKEGPALLGSGKIKWPEVVRALRNIDYRGWIILETTSPTEIVKDTRTNLEYARRLFEI